MAGPTAGSAPDDLPGHPAAVAHPEYARRQFVYPNVHCRPPLTEWTTSSPKTAPSRPSRSLTYVVDHGSNRTYEMVALSLGFRGLRVTAEYAQYRISAHLAVVRRRAPACRSHGRSTTNSRRSPCSSTTAAHPGSSWRGAPAPSPGPPVPPAPPRRRNASPGPHFKHGCLTRARYDAGYAILPMPTRDPRCHHGAHLSLAEWLPRFHRTRPPAAGDHVVNRSIPGQSHWVRRARSSAATVGDLVVMVERAAAQARVTDPAGRSRRGRGHRLPYGRERADGGATSRTPEVPPVRATTKGVEGPGTRRSLRRQSRSHSPWSRAG